MGLMKNKKGQTDSVFKLALVVIIIAAVLAVVSYIMGSAWGGSEDISEGVKSTAETVENSADCLAAGNCDNEGLGG